MGSGTRVDIHTRKYYRVVVEGIDPSQANEESFAIKLSMKTRSTPQRVRTVIRNLPYTLKSGLSATAANKLKGIIESIGGIVRIETHFVTPGRESESYRHHQDTSRAGKGPAEPEIEQIFICPECGHLVDEGKVGCEVCGHKFGAPKGTAPAGDEPPEPAGPPEPARPSGKPREKTPAGVDDDELTLTDVWRRYKLPIIAVGLALLLFLLLK